MVYIYRSMKVAGLFFGGQNVRHHKSPKLTIPKFLNLNVVFFFCIFFGGKTDPFPTLFGVEFPSWSWKSLKRKCWWDGFPYYYIKHINQQLKVSLQPYIWANLITKKTSTISFFFVWEKILGYLKGVVLKTGWDFENEILLPTRIRASSRSAPDHFQLHLNFQGRRSTAIIARLLTKRNHISVNKTW